MLFLLRRITLNILTGKVCGSIIDTCGMTSLILELGSQTKGFTTLH